MYTCTSWTSVFQPPKTLKELRDFVRQTGRVEKGLSHRRRRSEERHIPRVKKRGDLEASKTKLKKSGKGGPRGEEAEKGGPQGVRGQETRWAAPREKRIREAE